MAAKGYVVLYTNPRGSSNYGQDFGNIIQYNYPGDDYKDLMAGVDEILKKGYVDETRMGVTGGSGGGLLTNWVVTQTNRFKAAVSQRDISDWSNFWYTADFTLFTPTWFRKAPFEDPADFARRSPITHVAKIQTPLMFILGDEDYRTPPAAGGEELFRALKYLKRPTVMVRFPGENHELSRSGRPWHRVERLQHIVGWFDKWLLGKENATYEPRGRPSRQPAPQAQARQTPAGPTRANILRGEYGRYRANNDLLSYHLDVRVDPDKKFLSGKNAVRFKMLQDDTRIQLDLYDNLAVDKILLGTQELKHERELNAVFIDFPETLKRGREYSIDFHYSGTPRETGRFGGIAFRKDPAGRHWINTACEGEGSSIWWPSKDQWRDEVENMRLSVSIPNGLVDASNGRFIGKTDLGDGYTRWDWQINYPINSYNVSLNIGSYVQFSDRLGDLTLDFYVLPENLEKAKVQFAQAKPMIEGYQKYFGEYPFKKDGYKLIEVPYSGMEHQSAVTYGNRFANGYLERDWTGVGVSPKFDFIIIHESAHEWFGNSVSAADVSDMWIQEGWTTYLEVVYVEHMFGYDEALKYVNGYKSKVREQGSDHHRPRHPSKPVAGSVLQGRALPADTARRRQRRPGVVEADARHLSGVQVQEHHDRGSGAVLQQGDGEELDADLRPVPAARCSADARADVQRSRQHRVLSLEGGREGIRDADPSGESRCLADDQSDDRVEEAVHAAEERRVRGRD